MDKVLRNNRVIVIGELVEAALEVKQSKNTGNDYIAGTIVVKSIIEGREQLTELHLYSSAVKKDGNPNKFFQTYSGLQSKLGKRVSVQGELEENRYYNQGSGQVISFNRLKGVFVNDAKTADKDAATFEFAGYVVKPIAERLNKEGEVIFHEISLAQANYNGTMPVVAKFSVMNEQIVSAIEGLYEKGMTVKVLGDVSIINEDVEYTEATAFGDTITRIIPQTRRNYIITQGTEPATKGFYTDEQIIELDTAYMEETARLEADASIDVLNGDNPSTKDTPAKKGLNSLLL